MPLSFLIVQSETSARTRRAPSQYHAALGRREVPEPSFLTSLVPSYLEKDNRTGNIYACEDHHGFHRVSPILSACLPIIAARARQLVRSSVLEHLAPDRRRRVCEDIWTNCLNGCY
jgi:hypothetical protein